MIISGLVTYESPTDEMNRRWKQIIEKVLPAIDIIDLSAEHDYYYSKKRQFAPEYSQSSYLTMLSKEFSIGDYVGFAACRLEVQEEARRHMITLLEDLNNVKQYKEETLFLAASIADRYLVNLAVKGEKAPCLITLAVISTLMAAKLEQPIQPSYKRMCRLVNDEWKIEIERQALYDMEESIIRMLDFDLHYCGPIPFLERL